MNNHRVAACGLNGFKVNSFISESRECPIRVCAGHVFIIQNRISRSDGSACWHPITHHREATVCKLRCSAHFLGCFQLRTKMIRICISFSQSNYHLSTINSYQLLYSFKKAPNREKRKVTHDWLVTCQDAFYMRGERIALQSAPWDSWDWVWLKTV